MKKTPGNPTPKVLLSAVRRALVQAGDAGDAAFLQRFFRTGPGEYGEGDRFRGIRVPVLRSLSRRFAALPLSAVRRLLASRYHEDRLLALLLLVRRFERSGSDVRQQVVRLYLAHTAWINNWDLVDLSAPNILGNWLLERDDPAALLPLAASALLWERRIAMVACFSFIRADRCAVACAVAERLLDDPHDLIHKATGWMLREVGKRDESALRAFLDQHTPHMPRTALRYALERQTPAVRSHYLALPRTVTGTATRKRQRGS